jgi:hypothetical protein
MSQALKQKILKNMNKTLENNKLMKINQLLIIRRLLLITGSLLAAGQLHADTLAFWNMDGSGATKTNATTVNPGVTLTAGGGISTVNLGAVGTVVFHSDNYAAMNRIAGPTPETVSLAQDFANGTYFSFTLAPVAGSFSVTNISFYCMAGTATTSANREFFLESDATGFGTTSANVLYGGATQSALNPGGGINWDSTLIPFNTGAETLFSVDLSGNSAFANLTGSATFRFYIGTDTTAQTVGFEDLTVLGTVPEPSVYALAGLGLVLLSIGKKLRRTA